MKRTIFAILLISAAVLLARPAKLREPVPPGRTVVRYWEKWTGREGEQMKQIVDDFNSTVGKDKGIWVAYLSVSQVDQKTLTSTAAGVPPDVAGVWDTQLAQFAAMDALEPLDDLAAARGLTRNYYKPVYYDACRYNGHLYALPSTPMTSALHWNKKIFAENADQLRAAGLDPDRAPRTLQELDRYAEVIDKWSAPRRQGGRLLRAGYIPQEPGWYLPFTPYWFGGDFYDIPTRRLTFTDPRMIAAYDWVQGYTRRLGLRAMLDFRSGLPQNNFDTPQNPFLTGDVAMVLQGPWMANYIEQLNPAMNRWKMSKQEEAKLPRDKRRENYMWGVAPFPSAVPGLENVCYAATDILAIPRGSKHVAEAFEFIAFVNRQDEIEKLCSLHCKNSPLARPSRQFIENHPNPYIEVFDELASSPNAHALPSLPVWPEVSSELAVISDKVYLMQGSPAEILRDAQDRTQAKLDRFFARQQERSDKVTR